MIQNAKSVRKQLVLINVFVYIYNSFSLLLQKCEEAYHQSEDVADYNRLYHLRCKNDYSVDFFDGNGKYRKLPLCLKMPISLIRHCMDKLKYLYVCTCDKECTSSGIILNMIITNLK